LCNYDLVIVDPNSNFNPTKYCTTISEPTAYVSLGEVAENAPYRQDIKPSWVIGKNKSWNNNLVIDQTQEDWQKYFISKMIDPLWKKGYKGFFLDTLDSYYLATQDPKEQQKQIDSIVNLIQQIKSKYPSAKIILNRGFQLLPKVHSQIDAVVIESLYDGWNQAKNKYEGTSLIDQQTLLREIAKIKELKLPIIIVDYLPPNQKSDAIKLADRISKQDLIPWITDSTLQEIYLNKIKVIPRKILIISSNKNELLLETVSSLSYIDTVLEYMGYITHHINIDDAKMLANGDLSQEYAGIILHIETESSKYEPLIRWVQKQISNRIPVVFTNNFTVPRDNESIKSLGLSFSPIEGSSYNLKITKINPRFIGFEMKPLSSPYQFNPVHTKSSQIWLQVQNNLKQIEDAVAITPWGGYALEPYFIQYLPNNHALWIVNPFEFFHQALRLQDFPIPDVTTENGKRLMTVHIDGDGFALMAKWVGGSFAARELYTHILNRFQIPTSVSVITGEIAPNGVNANISNQLMEIARKIFALPWVEIASHSFSHPFNWQKIKDKTGQLEGENYSLKIPNYKFNLETEITGSVNFINKYLAPPNKKCKLFFWSGMADPSYEALAIASREKLLNINGLPDTYINNFQPSITGVTPMGMEVGPYFQVFSPIDGDFYFMNNLAGPLYGYEKVIQTLQLTDKPRRLKPIDLYYHIYSAGYPASLEALIKVYTWALEQSVMNVYISDYIKIVIDYFQTKIAHKNGSWIIYNSGNLRELRSQLNQGYPNIIKSENVIGFKVINNQLYIHLGPNNYTVLTYQKNKPKQPYIIDANGRVTAFYRKKNQLIINFKGYMPLTFTLDNVANCSVTSQNPLNISPNPDGSIRYNSLKVSDEIYINC
jgi:uncharacterized protein (TIGR01370 family)